MSKNYSREYTQLQARRGLAIYFAILMPLTVVFQALMIVGSLAWFLALIWSLAVASVVACLMLSEGFVDVSFQHIEDGVENIT